VTEYDVAIVGGGFSGAMVAVNLARRTDFDFSLCLFEPNELGRGAAYGTSCPAHVLNTRANAMSAFADDPEHFIRWLGRRGTPDEFVSRELYGGYIGELVSRAFARDGLSAVRNRVVSVSKTNGAFELKTASGIRSTARCVVLATGNAAPGEDGLPGALVAHPGYVADPWRFDYRRVGGHVLLLGTGLTAVDVLVALEFWGHRAAVHAVSRRGRFPETHADGIADLGVTPVLETGGAGSLLRSFRSRLRDARARGCDWRAVVDAIRPESESLWRRLAPAEQRRFDRHLRSRWERYRHRAPAQADAARARYLAAGRLTLHGGRVAEVRNGWFVIEAADGRRTELRPDWIFNCTGPGRSGKLFGQPPLAGMLERGIASCEPLGLGIRVDAGLAAIGSDGQVVPGLWAIGPLARGSRFEATAVPELRLMAQLVAGSVRGELETGRLDGRRFLDAEAII
jgi:uncharacterized NAD(P)/FAD-binding protein YdhS